MQIPSQISTKRKIQSGRPVSADSLAQTHHNDKKSQTIVFKQNVHEKKTRQFQLNRML